ncbi:MAG: DNA polymerase/3'-5' exonuclease PolX, partial [Pyrinomonadaceae bacterium]|nr:DNA polymerase/3'-5' exonuclease PolX [Phycisphaerales bacterium]
MSINPQLAEQLTRIARLQELLGFEKFRAISIERAARVVEGHPTDFASLATNRALLLEIDGIGPKIADKIMEFCSTGAIKELAELTSQVPAGLIPLLDVQGLGPKTVRMLWQEGGVTDAAFLRKIIDDGSILTLPRMGEKSAQKIKESLAMLDEGAKRLALGRAVPVAEAFIAHLRKLSTVEKIAFAGSLRRGKDTIGDIDILVATRTPAEVSEAFRSMPQVRHVLVAGDTKSSVKAALRAPIVAARIDGVDQQVSTEPTIQVDLRVVPAESWGAALMYFTGSKEHNVRLRERALKMGMTLNEYGLFPEDDNKEPPQKRGVKPVASATEEEVYARLGLRWVPPELREDRGEVGIFELESRMEQSPSP